MAGFGKPGRPRKFDRTTARTIRELRKKGTSPTELQQQFNVSYQTLLAVINRTGAYANS